MGSVRWKLVLNLRFTCGQKLKIFAVLKRFSSWESVGILFTVQTLWHISIAKWFGCRIIYQFNMIQTQTIFIYLGTYFGGIIGTRIPPKYVSKYIKIVLFLNHLLLINDSTLNYSVTKIIQSFCTLKSAPTRTHYVWKKSFSKTENIFTFLSTSGSSQTVRCLLRGPWPALPAK
jgi:hypothetical protein